MSFIFDMSLEFAHGMKGGMIAFHDIAENEDGGPRFWSEIKNKYKSEEIITSKDMGIGIIYV